MEMEMEMEEVEIGIAELLMIKGFRGKERIGHTMMRKRWKLTIFSPHRDHPREGQRKKNYVILE
jgi:hypothetical protein